MNDLNGGGTGGGADKKLAQKGRERERVRRGRHAKAVRRTVFSRRRGIKDGEARKEGRKEGPDGRRCGKVAWRGVVSLLSAPRRQVQSESDVVTA